MSIRELEEQWLEDQTLLDLRNAIYYKLPIVIAANDLDGRKPFLALEKLFRLASSAVVPQEESKKQEDTPNDPYLWESGT